MGLRESKCDIVIIALLQASIKAKPQFKIIFKYVSLIQIKKRKLKMGDKSRFSHKLEAGQDFGWTTSHEPTP